MKPDIVHCHEPDSLFVAYLLKKRFPYKLIYDCHEFHPQSFTDNFPKPFGTLAKIFVERVENFLASRADAVITVNKKLVERFDRFNKTVVLLPNYPRMNIFSKITRKRELFSSDELRLIYVGGLSVERGIFRMLNILRKLDNSIKVRLILIGKFSSIDLENEFRQYINKYKITDKVDYKGYLSHEDTISNLMNADIGLCLLSGRERYGWSEPIKYSPIVKFDGF